MITTVKWQICILVIIWSTLLHLFICIFHMLWTTPLLPEKLAVFQKQVSAYKDAYTSVCASYPFNLKKICKTSKIPPPAFDFLFYLIHFLHYYIIKNIALTNFIGSSTREVNRKISSGLKHLTLAIMSRNSCGS